MVSSINLNSTVAKHHANDNVCIRQMHGRSHKLLSFLRLQAIIVADQSLTMLCRSLISNMPFR